jgi:hypothetical protein
MKLASVGFDCLALTPSVLTHTNEEGVKRTEPTSEFAANPWPLGREKHLSAADPPDFSVVPASE